LSHLLIDYAGDIKITPGTYTYYPVLDGSVYSYVGGNDYASCRAGSGLTASSTADNDPCGQAQFGTGGQFYIWEQFYSFDTAGIPAGATITSTFSLYGKDDQSTNDFTIEARISDWGATLTTADWIAGASLGTPTLVASKSTSGGIATNAYTDFTSEAAFATSLNRTGPTRLLVSSSRHRLGNAPGNITNEYVVFWMSEKGTTYRPKLTVVIS
jgi:hypothetical protein